MKLQKAQETGERKPRTVMPNQVDTTMSISNPSRDAHPLFHDLHAHIAGPEGPVV